MDLRTVMVHLDPEHGNDARLRIAARLAEQCEARLIGVTAAELALPPYYAEGAFAQDILDHERAELRRRMTEMEARFREAVGGRVKDAEWRSAVALPAPFVAREARAADLVVAGGLERDADIDTVARLDPSDLVMQVGRPVLLVPPEPRSQRLDAVLIAWKDTPETRRAVWGALPLLRRAESIDIVEVVDDDEDRAAAVRRLADVTAWLDRHGLKATPQVPGATRQVSETLDRLAADAGAGLIVAGAYGHSRMREWLLGGVTRHLVTRSPVCSLLMH